MAVVLDIQGTQSELHADRGIARYLVELAVALEERRQDLVSSYALDRRLAVPGALERLRSGGKLTYQDELDNTAVRVYHVGSPFELTVPFRQVWPNLARSSSVSTVVTLYDLIPLIFRDPYLSDAAHRTRYKARLELIRHADRVLAISEASAADAIEQLGISPDRVTVVGAGVSARFRPASSRRAALATAARELAQLEAGFVMYTGGVDARKNFGRLLEAYAALPDDLRAEHQLVVVCDLEADRREALAAQCRELRISDRVLLTGFVSEELLLALYQACHLFVFPSLYEGFGLPVVEALACGAAVIAGRSSSLTEIIREPTALFDPTQVTAIRQALEAVLRTPERLDALRRSDTQEVWSWERVAARTERVYEELLAAPRRSRSGFRVACVSPLPPQRSGVADYSARLFPELAKRCELHVFSDGTSPSIEGQNGMALHPVRSFEFVEGAVGGFDRVLYMLGNSEFHANALALLRKRSGVVLAHDVRLVGLYWWCATHRPDIEPRAFEEILLSMYAARLEDEPAADGPLSFEDLDRLGVFMASEAISSAEAFLVHSQYAAQIARLEAPPGMEGKVDVVPFGAPPPPSGCRVCASADPLVATFGYVDRIKQVDKVIRAMPRIQQQHPRARLALVGPITPSEAARLKRLAISVGLSELIITGDVGRNEFDEWLMQTVVAVQLRAVSNGETPASVHDCFSAGVPVITTDLGAARELPDSCVVKVPVDIMPDTLADLVTTLVADTDMSRSLASAAQAYATHRSFARVAEHLVRRLRRS